MFTLDLLPRIELKDYYNEQGRVYQTPAGDFPSVTTVIGQTTDKSHLEEWKTRLGHEKAARETKAAAEGGTELHGVLEKYLLNEDYSDEYSISKMRFASVKRKITPHIQKIYGVEFPLFDAELQTAGRADAIINWDGRDAILDLKTTKAYKREEWVLHYFIQAATYGIMTKCLNISKIIIVFSTEDFDCYYFEKDLCDYNDHVRRIFIEDR